MKIAIIDLGVRPSALDSMIDTHYGAHPNNRFRYYARESLQLTHPRVRPLVWHRISGIDQRTVRCAASAVWLYDKLMFVTTVARLSDMFEAIEVAVRTGRPFDVYVFGEKQDMTQFAQVDVSTRRGK